MTSCAASLTASSLSPSSGSGAGAGADARAADSGAATRWAAHLPSSPASTSHTSVSATVKTTNFAIAL